MANDAVGTARLCQLAVVEVLVVVPDAEMQIRTIDGWWRENRVASPALFAASETI